MINGMGISLLNSRPALRASAQGDGAALSNSTTPTSLLPTEAKLILPPNFLRIGTLLHVVALGRVSNIVTSPGTLTLDLRLGGGTVVANGGAMNLNIVAKTNATWWLEWWLTCRAGGAAANFMHQGIWSSESFVGSPTQAAGGAGCASLPASAPAVGSNFDQTIAQTLDLFATFNTANAGNSIQLHQYKVTSI